LKCQDARPLWEPVWGSRGTPFGLSHPNEAANGRIEWRAPSVPATSLSEPEPSRLSKTENVVLFRRLFRRRLDAYPILWESRTTGKSRFAPACANEWQAGVCEKPRIK